MSRDVSAVVVAAGRGRRLGRSEPKAFVTVAGRPLLAYSLAALHRVDRVGELVVVLPPGQRERLADLADRYRLGAAVEGGRERWQSVAAGLRALSGKADLVLIHDAARPLATPELFLAVIEKAAEVGAAVAATPLTDTLKEVGPDLLIRSTLDRSRYWRAQTPQVFRRELIIEAYRQAEKLQPTDDAQLVEALGAPVAIVPSLGPNPKVTTPADLLLVEQLVREQGSDTGPAAR